MYDKKLEENNCWTETENANDYFYIKQIFYNYYNWLLD